MEKLLKLEEVKERTRICRSEIYRMMKTGEFPKSVKISFRAVAWVESEIEQWIQERIAQSRSS